MEKAKGICLCAMFFLLMGLSPRAGAVTTGVVYDLGSWSTNTTTYQIDTNAPGTCWSYDIVGWPGGGYIVTTHGGYPGNVVFRFTSATPISTATFHMDSAHINISANVKFAIAVSTDGVNYTDIFAINGPYLTPGGGEESFGPFTTGDLNHTTRIYLKWYTADLGGGTNFYTLWEEIPSFGTPYSFNAASINNVPDISSFGDGLYLFPGADSPIGHDMVTKARAAGAALARDCFYWSLIEPTNNNFVWTDTDESINVLEQHWLKPFEILYNWPAWTTPDTQTGWNDYADVLTRLIARYKPRVKHWEVWNEPDAGMTAANYYNLLRTAYLAAKVEDPDCKIVAPAETFPLTEWGKQLAALGGYNYMDIYSFHLYAIPRSGSPESSDFVGNTKMLKQYLVANNGPTELWLTETGWNTDDPDQYMGRPIAVTLAEQARYIVRAYVGCLSAGVNKVFQFTLGNYGGGPAGGWGLLDNNYNPKLSYTAYRTMTNELEGFTYSSELGMGTNARGYVFTNGLARRVVVWSLVGTRNIKLDLNATASTVVQLDGTSTAGSMTGEVLSLNLKEDPQFIEGATGTITVVQSDYHLTTDSSFEDFTWYNSNPAYITKDTSSYYTVNASCRIKQPVSGEVFMASSNDLQVNSARTYTLSVWIKTSSISSNGVAVNVLELDKNSQNPSWYLNASGSEDLIKVTGTTAWTNYQYTLNNIKGTTWKLRLYLRGYRGGGTRYAWFDDVRVTRVPDDQDNNLVPYGDMECGTANIWLKDSANALLWPVNTTSAEGDFSGKIIGGAGYVQNSSPIDASKAYTLRACIKTENITNANGAYVSVLQFDANSVPLGWYYIGGSERLISSGGTTDWIRGSVTLNAWAPGTYYVAPYLKNDDPDSNAIAYFDEILLTLN